MYYKRGGSVVQGKSIPKTASSQLEDLLEDLVPKNIFIIRIQLCCILTLFKVPIVIIKRRAEVMPTSSNFVEMQGADTMLADPRPTNFPDVTFGWFFITLMTPCGHTYIGFRKPCRTARYIVASYNSLLSPLLSGGSLVGWAIKKQ